MLLGKDEHNEMFQPWVKKLETKFYLLSEHCMSQEDYKLHIFDCLSSSLEKVNQLHCFDFHRISKDIETFLESVT